MREFFLFFIAINFGCFCSAQYKTVMGQVTDKNNQPIGEVRVYSDSGLDTELTDIGGIYRITIPQSCDTLFFSKSGYAPASVLIGTNSEINVRLEVVRVYDLSIEDLLNTKVSTVSLHEQNISDAPGVVSIITHDDLRKLGIRTVKDALSLVPGYMLLQNDDEQIFSVRGIFATTNQKILVMRDGHSLNEANLDIPMTEYSLSIENIEKIEIIRGPGASIYGNSAMASVVNIITRNNERTEMKLSTGSYGQLDVDAYLSKKINEHHSVLIYGRYACTSGESLPVKYQLRGGTFPGYYKAGHYPNNYDLGIKYRMKDFTVSFSSRHHEYKTYWSTQGGVTHTDSLLAKPGLLMNNLHFDLAYETKLEDNLKVRLVHTIDNARLDNNRLVSLMDQDKYLNGRIQLNEWNASKFGINYYAQWSYSLMGQLQGGISVERRNYNDSWLASNTEDSSVVTFSRKPFYPRGKELRSAFYVQVQHDLNPWLRFDCGVRLDMAQEFKSAFNPRIALIAIPMPKMNVKLIYTKAFQAPGYSYRTSNADFSGSIESLEPEKLSTFQGSVRYNHSTASYVEATVYYNRLSNLITRTDQNYYANYGKIGTYGLELDIRQSIKPLSVFLNYSLLLPDTNYIDKGFKTRNIYENSFRHFSKHTINGGMLYSYKKKFDVSVYGQYASGFHSLPGYRVRDRVVVNSNFDYKVTNSLSLALSVYNVFDQLIQIGDPSVIPLKQPGRWWRFSLSYTIL